ncbi:hypothetical protein HPB52_000415 [Rhipicephalus sanguineus]|uniref:Uncharacterized protein n=1 Tax=Rhipicephalus sanguineus TaxID=34632 RepID=A0A9D4QGI8_RHISA|nr:hypothetical protein HPB52_000415 [Rhipicephalus sanguineus]
MLAARVQQEPDRSRDMGQELVSKHCGAQPQSGAPISGQACGRRHSGFILAEPSATSCTLRSRKKNVTYVESLASSSRLNMRVTEKRRRTSTNMRSPVSTNDRQLRKRPRREEAPLVDSAYADQRGRRSADGRENNRDGRGSATAGMLNGTGENQRGPRRSSRKGRRSMEANGDSVARAPQKRPVSARAPRRASNSKAKKRKQASLPSTTSGVRRSKRRRTVATAEPDIPAAAPARRNTRGSRKRLPLAQGPRQRNNAAQATNLRRSRLAGRACEPSDEPAERDCGR